MKPVGSDQASSLADLDGLSNVGSTLGADLLPLL
jgi:hypothetical protein